MKVPYTVYSNKRNLYSLQGVNDIEYKRTRVSCITSKSKEEVQTNFTNLKITSVSKIIYTSVVWKLGYMDICNSFSYFLIVKTD
jgi:hypothetical protein